MIPPDVRPGDRISAKDFNAVKKLAARKFSGPGIFQTNDLVMLRPTHVGSGVQMRWVAIAGQLPLNRQVVACYPVERSGDPLSGDEQWSVALVQNFPRPATTEVIAVWPHLAAEDFDGLILRTGQTADSDGNPLYDYDIATGVLTDRATLCPVYKVDGLWRVHNLARLRWTTPDATFLPGDCEANFNPLGLP